MSLFCNVNAFRYSYFIDAPFVWNKLPSVVVNASIYSAFKFRFKISVVISDTLHFSA